jgi:hypothetical protein
LDKSHPFQKSPKSVGTTRVRAAQIKNIKIVV